MKRILLGLIVLIAPLFLAYKEDVRAFAITKVVIDAGHGGHDAGCLGGSSKEKEVTLAVALKLGKYIEENFNDVKVIYTRKTDVFVELHERASIANSNKADFFICIHCNSGPKEAVGAETYVMGLHKSEDNLSVAKRENASIMMEENYKSNYEGFDPNSPESYIAFSLYQNAFMSQSLSFASKVQSQFKEKTGRFSRGVKQAGFLVLYKTTMPSVLIEMGFLTNPHEEKFLNGAQGQDQIASAIFRAFRDYKLEKEGIVKHPAISEGTVSKLPETENVSEKEKSEKENDERENIEKERLAKETAEKERIAKAERERIEREKLEKEKIAKEKLEKERMSREKLEKERIAREKLEKERIAREKLEKERIAKEKFEKERIAREKEANMNREREAIKKAESLSGMKPDNPPGRAARDTSGKLDAASVADNRILYIFSVQIGISTKPLPLNNEFFKGIDKNRIYSENSSDGVKYTVGNVRKVSEAIVIQNEMRNMGFAGAFVVAYKNGKRISVSEATSQMEK